MTSRNPSVSLISGHIRTQLLRHTSSSPLFVAIQGPQGCGKTYLTSLLAESLDDLSVTILSMDDLYLPYSQLCDVEKMYSGNQLLKGRGLPGTHDVQLGEDILNALKHVNQDGADAVTLPVFDKSLQGGKGDRLPDGVVIKGPVDVVVMEGWCMGFCSIGDDEIDKRWSTMSHDKQSWCSKENVAVVNDKLREYVAWWDFFDVFVQVSGSTKHRYALNRR
jgi:D-glycerate 3-kinase